MKNTYNKQVQTLPTIPLDPTRIESFFPGTTDTHVHSAPRQGLWANVDQKNLNFS